MPKIAYLLSIVAAPFVSVALLDVSLGGRNTEKVITAGKTALQLIRTGQPYQLNQAIMRWSALASAKNCDGHGENGPYIKCFEREYERNLEEVEKLPQEQKTMIECYHSLVADNDGLVDPNRLCTTLLRRECKMGRSLSLEDMKAAFGAGLRSLQDKKLRVSEIRVLFRALDQDNNGELSFKEMTAGWEAAIGSTPNLGASMFLSGFEAVLSKKAGMNFVNVLKYWYDKNEEDDIDLPNSRLRATDM